MSVDDWWSSDDRKAPKKKNEVWMSSGVNNIRCNNNVSIHVKIFWYSRLEHFCGTGSERKRPFGSPVALAALLFLTSLMAAKDMATQQQAVSVKSVSFICKEGEGISWDSAFCTLNMLTRYLLFLSLRYSIGF